MATVSSTNMLSPESISFIRPADYPVLLIVNIVTALILFLAIFLYKNARRQKILTMLSMLLLVVAMITEGLLLYNWDTAAGSIEWLGSIFLLLCALIFAFLAWRGIRSDERLLRAADRLR